MKTKLCVWIFLLGATFAQAQTNNLTALLQQGLFEEQANRNLDAAIADYQTLATQFDKDRQMAATAVFRLGECYRMQGKTNEAATQYERIIRDFSDQTTLITLSRQNLTGLGTTTSEMATSEISGGKLWDRVKNLPQAQLEQVLPTLAPDLILTELLQQRNTAQAKLAQLQVEFSPNHPDVQKQKALLDTINKQIEEKINGMMQALKLRFEISESASSTSPAQANSPPPYVPTTDSEIQRLQQMIKDSPDLINSPSSDELFRAASSGELRVATFLLDHGADANSKFNGNTPLNGAAMNGQKAMIELLLSRGADVNTRNSSGGTALLTATGAGYKSVVEVLLAHKADVNEPYTKMNNEETPLHLAARNGYVNLVNSFLAAGAHPNVEASDGRTPLSYATENGSSEIVQALLAAGADVNTQGANGRTPLSYAAETGDPKLLKLLLDAKADPNGGKLDAPLLCAIHKQDVESAALLLQNGAAHDQDGAVDWRISINNTIFSGISSRALVTPLWVAVSAKQLPMVNLLLKFKADPDDSQTDGRPLLFRALSDANILEALLNAGAKVDPVTPDENQWTPLGAAAGQNYAPAVEILLKHGANPNARNRNGATPLHWAAYQLASSKVFELLLANKADPNVRSSNGKTPLDELKGRTKQNSNDEQLVLAGQLANLLHQHGALDNPPDWNRIMVIRPSANFSEAVFRKGTNDWNHFTLLESIVPLFDVSPLPDGLAFPDFAHVVVIRPSSANSSSKIAVNLLNNTNGIDCSKDIPLEFGDVVEIPERGHTLAERDTRTPEEIMDIRNYLKGKAGEVKLIVDGGQTIQLPLKDFGDVGLCDIRTALGSSRSRDILTTDSDLLRVKVIRRNPKTEKTDQWILDCSSSSQGYWPYFFIRDGDVIEVPEKP